MKAVFFIVGLVLGLTGGYLLWKASPVIPEVQTVTITDTVPEPYAVYYPKVVYKDTGSHTILIDSVPFPVPFALPVDTQAIVKDYLAVREYNIDTTTNEIRATLNMNIYANRVLNYDLSLTNERICSYTNSFKLGLMVGIDDFTPLAAYQRNKFTYMAGYDIYGQEKGIRIGVMYKIK